MRPSWRINKQEKNIGAKRTTQPISMKGKKIIEPKPNNEPGPGSYNPKCICCQHSKGITMGKRFESNAKNQESPGPGSYNPK